MKGDDVELDAARRRRPVTDGLFNHDADDGFIHQAVSSSNIASIAYHAERRVLQVTFRSGATWNYGDVDPAEYRALATSDSVGSHFHKHIKARKPATQVS